MLTKKSAANSRNQVPGIRSRISTDGLSSDNREGETPPASPTDSMARKSVAKDRRDLRRFRQFRLGLRFKFDNDIAYRTEEVFRQLEIADRAIAFLESKLRHGAGI